MAEARVNPRSLVAARQRAGLSPAALAERLGQPLEKIEAWEAGEKQPTFAQARRIASVLHAPFAALFVEPTALPPVELPDLRTVGRRRARFSVDLVDVYQDALFKQDWVREERRADEVAPLAFVGAGAGKTDPMACVEALRALLDIERADRAACGSAAEFLRLLIRRAEAAGVLVLRSSTVGANTHRRLDVEEFRGFAISDPLAPLVFINTADAKAAQVFTLIHELAHLWRAETGISRPDVEHDEQNQAETEAFCDEVAAELLVPADELRAVWDDHAELAANADVLRRAFKVSALVIARRARDLRLTTQRDYAAFAAEQMKLSRTKNAGAGGPSFLLMVQLRNGGTLTEMVVRAVAAGRLLYRDAGMLLGVQPPVIDKLAAGFAGAH